ncbi:MAG: WYL domain-containing protein [Prevotellaceae bacterium]|jgi:predicted DNA-binding transcriptional regulator YafY|nr:WYL domain-containing protein [Prevotellaceae bacterium]
MSQTQVLLRDILIINKIKNTPYIGLVELTDSVEHALSLRGIDNLGMSRRTLLRDIQSIRTDFSIDIQYSHLHNGYFIEETDIRYDVEQFLDSFEVFSALNMEDTVPDFVFAEKHRPRGTQHLFPLIYAIKNSQEVRFSYSKFQGNDFSERHLEPYALKEARGRWYAIGRSVGQKDMKSYGLDRITDLEITDSRFKKDTSVKLQEKFRDSFGIYSSDEYPVEDVVLSFDAEDGHYLKSLPLHSSQEIIKDDDNEFIIRLHLKITHDFVMEILSRSWSLKVIEPASLREQVREIYSAALKRNNG